MREPEAGLPTGGASARDRKPKFYHAAHALAVHSVNSPNGEAAVEMDGVRRSIWGHSTSILAAGVPVVVLYSDDSTTRNVKMNPEAEVNFLEAARRLLKEGVEFYTVLRPSWAVRAVLWTREYR